ncbi:hypothetical protein NP493_275g03006 [Ridgeia piscesae]|uniref:EGF-like domain-containing protein n=1 Tax=Ridgeia piscesae TaxID=27915 RepID=A0AAD9UCD2_RIDPI|nr:hypothetical protein NP493_275g03006 [Ridgeia piscesae]
MIWADSNEVGCGMSFCKSMEGFSHPNSYYLVCDYVPPGNWEGKKPYETGDPCSKCPQSRPKCENKLCREEAPCSSKECLNGGTVDPVACECKCTADYKGSACENGAPARDISRLRTLSIFLSVLISCVVFG